MIRPLFQRFLFLGMAALLAASPFEASAQSSSGSSSKKKTTQSSSSSSAKKKAASSSSSTAAKKKSVVKAPSKPRPRTAPSAPAPDAPIVPRAFNGVPVTHSASVVVFDPVTGRVLHEKNSDEARPPASTQKLLTALIIAEEGNLDKRIVIQHSDTLAEPVKLYLKAGQSYTRRQLLEVLMVRSFNDVAVALARDNAGSVEAFAAKMNRKAAELGMTRSYFVNPNGLPAPGQNSTARDMAKLARAAYENGTIRQAVSIKHLTFRYADGRVRELKNTNRVLRGYPYCNGMKTGYTQAAGHCLISSGSYNGRDVIVVMLGSDRRHVWQDSCSLLAWGLAR